ncbi:unnamed protein product, partial [Prorocentrum cordatum]
MRASPGSCPAICPDLSEVLAELHEQRRERERRAAGRAEALRSGVPWHVELVTAILGSLAFYARAVLLLCGGEPNLWHEASILRKSSETCYRRIHGEDPPVNNWLWWILTVDGDVCPQDLSVPGDLQFTHVKKGDADAMMVVTPGGALQCYSAAADSIDERHYNWAHQLNSSGDRSVHEHFYIMKVLELAAGVDQLNIPALVSLEALGRRAMLIEQAHLNSPGSPDYTGADDFMGWGPGRGRALVAPTLVKHVAEKARDKASVYKELRKHNEELRLRRPPKGRRRLTDEVSESIWALNWLVGSSTANAKFSSLGQRATVDHLYETINSFRPPPQAVSDEEAMRALLGSRAPYGGDDDLTVVPYDRALAIPGDGRVPVPLAEVLPLDAAKLIVDFDTHLIKDDSQWGAEVERGLEHIGSYMDPRLRFSRSSYLNFIGVLFR